MLTPAAGVQDGRGGEHQDSKKAVVIREAALPINDARCCDGLIP